MKRLLFNRLIDWKNKKDRKPLILRGARQVGKTWLLKDFGKKEFSQYHHIDFEKNKNELVPLFENSISPEKIIFNLALFLNREIDVKKDLLIFDEIQNAPRALTSLKYFCEDMPDIAVCAAGSLLGIAFSGESYPVGKVECLDLYPMNFEEFLLNYDNEMLYKAYLTAFNEKSTSSLIHGKLKELLKEFYVTGGMPEVLKLFFEKRSDKSRVFKQVRSKQKDLLSAYMEDFYKHSGKTNALHISSVFENISMQLSGNFDNSVKRYKFKGVIPGKKGYAELQSPIDWLLKAGLIIKVRICNKSELPFKAFCKDNIFKLYLFDIGILGAMLEIPPATIILDDYNIIKGFFVENFVAADFMATGMNSLYSWTERNSEVEFLMERNGEIIPIEVKSGVRTKAKSLQQYILKYAPKTAYMLSGKQFSFVNNTKQNIPLYYAGKLVT